MELLNYEPDFNQTVLLRSFSSYTLKVGMRKRIEVNTYDVLRLSPKYSHAIFKVDPDRLSMKELLRNFNLFIPMKRIYPELIIFGITNDIEKIKKPYLLHRRIESISLGKYYIYTDVNLLMHRIWALEKLNLFTEYILQDRMMILYMIYNHVENEEIENAYRKAMKLWGMLTGSATLGERKNAMSILSKHLENIFKNSESFVCQLMKSLID